MDYSLALPEKKDELEALLYTWLKEGESARAVEEVNWWVIYYYLKGVRDFGPVDYATGTLTVNYVDADGVLKFRLDDVVSKYQAQIGRMMQMDLAPSVTKKHMGLDDLRKASIAQVLLEYVMPSMKILALQQQAISMLLRYGTIGLAVWSENQGDEMGIDILPPWEILPISPNPMEARDVRGLCRIRTVPKEWVKKLDIAPGPQHSVWDEMEGTDSEVGVNPGKDRPAESGRFSTVFQSVRVEGLNIPGTPGNKGHKVDKTISTYVKFVEVCTLDSQGYLDEYLVFAGSKLLHRSETAYRGKKMQSPLQYAVDIPAGGFWGRSFVSTLLPISIEEEYSLGRMFQNMQDTDIYGMLVEPTTLGIPAEVFIGRDGVKRIRYEPDYTSPELKPFNIAPANVGMGPIKLLEVANGLQSQIANQPTELMKGDAPGRVDSHAGLGFLYETANTPLTPTATSLVIAFSNCYKCLLSLMRMQWPDDKPVSVSMLDDSLAGIVLDPRTGMMHLQKESIPHPEEVSVSVLSMLPKSEQQEIMQLLESLKLGMLTPEEFAIQIKKRGLRFPVGFELEWQNYRQAVLENIVLFGDGVTPGEIKGSERDLHMLHLKIHREFQARPEFKMASPAVRQAFAKLDEYHLLQMGTIPDQAPHMEDAAVEQEAMAKMAASASRGGPGGMAGMGSVPGM